MPTGISVSTHEPNCHTLVTIRPGFTGTLLVYPTCDTARQGTRQLPGLLAHLRDAAAFAHLLRIGLLCDLQTFVLYKLLCIVCTDPQTVFISMAIERIKRSVVTNK